MSTYDPPCYVSDDHRWRGSSLCRECGARLRCLCGQFVREDAFDDHETRCPWLIAHAAEIAAEMVDWCEACGDHIDEHCSNDQVIGPCQSCECSQFVPSVAYAGAPT